MSVTRNLCNQVMGSLTSMYTMYASLFVNNHTPTVADALDASDYTEAAGSWYSPILLDGWGTVDTGNGYSRSTNEEVSWTPDVTSGTAYGIFVTDGGGNLLYAIAFDTPVAITAGVPIRATVRLTAKDPAATTP